MKAILPLALLMHTIVRHYGAIIGFNPALERKMQRHKHFHQPAIPKSFDEAERLLQEFPEYR